ncbi:MAG: DUF1549 and DUF1553 domain-containing protein [Verrucomicrobiota bacterium]
MFPRVLLSAIIYATSVFCFLSLQAGEKQEQKHWAFQPIVRAVVPKAALGEKNPIDAFIGERLKVENLRPSMQADERTLLRRLHLDLTGLPPQAKEVVDFVAAWQKDAEQAYREKVDELLASPHFGERWGRHWLDMARYADSDGYLGDTLRPWAWVYRDWVISAINRDQAFDQFSIEQLAGDLLPQATLAQKIATGFHRNTMLNTEAGVDKALYRTKEVIDRVSATGTVWLGLTVACAECHDHKHDPITQAEFYQLYAFFNNADEKNISAPLPGALENYKVAQQAWQAKAAQLERPLIKYQNEGLLANQAAWEESVVLPKVKWEVLKPDETRSGAGDKMEVQKDGSIVVTGKDPDTVTYFIESPVTAGQRISGIRLQVFGEAGYGQQLGKSVGRAKDGSFVLSSLVVQQEVEGAKPQTLKIKSVKADFAEKDQKLEHVLDNKSTQGWHVVTQPQQPHTLLLELAQPVELKAGSRLKFTLRNKFGKGKTLRHFRLAVTSAASIGEPSIISEVAASALAIAAEKRSAEQSQEIAKFYRSLDPVWRRLRLGLEKHLNKPATKISTKARAFVERKKDRRETFVHIRGDYTQHGDRVVPGTPAVLHALRRSSEGGQANRLDLARWLFDESNPLTARVAVNQIWLHLFGQGLVATPDDFGTEGSPPTHPKLLDWLASEYRRLGWSRKDMIRLIVHSSSYRQSSDVRPELADYATGNLLLWRQNSFRISAETVRDIHLAASGLLTRKIGGPGIRPPLPSFVSEVGRSVKWPVSQGDDLYRRGMYIILKRTVIYPMLTAFDAPDTSVSCSRRDRTNTPMQALTLLNDPVFYECAETLGSELYAKYGKHTEAAILEMYERCLNREPLSAEMQTLLSAHADLARNAINAEASMIAAVRIVMNLDEFITRN